MSSEASPPRTILCEEVFDDNSQPSDEEIREYAIRIGIEPSSEPQLLPLARDGLMKALPTGWTPCFDHKKKAWYYFNHDNGMSQWEHPLDCVYRDLVRKSRSESASSAGEDDSKTSVKEDLKSFEEVSGISLDPVPKQIDIFQPSGTLLRRATTQLAPIKKLPARLQPVPADFKPKYTPRPPPSPTPAPSVSGAARADDKLQKAQEKHPKSMHGRTELTLSGGGTSFLKKPTTPSSDSSVSEDNAAAPQIWAKPSVLAPPRGILRDKSPQRDGDPKTIKVDGRHKDLEEERKSVRFNLEEGDGLQIKFLEEEDAYLPAPQVKFPNESVTICLHPPDGEQAVEDWSSDEEDPRLPQDGSAVLNVKEAFTGYGAGEAAEKQGKSRFEVVRVPEDVEAKVREDITSDYQERKEKLIHDMDVRLVKLKEHLENEEAMAIRTAHNEKEAKLQMIEESIAEELRMREANIREGAERTLQKLQEELAESMEHKLSTVQEEQRALLAEREAVLQQLREENSIEIVNSKRALREDLEAQLAEEQTVIEKEKTAKLELVKKEMSDEYDQQVCELLEKLRDERAKKEESLKFELETDEKQRIADLQLKFEKNFEERKIELEKQQNEEVAVKQVELDVIKNQRVEKMQCDMDQQLSRAKERVADEHNKIVDKMKMDQLVTLENLRGCMRKEEEDLQAAHAAKLAGLTERLNSEYETRLKRLKELAERKHKLLDEQESTTKFEQQGTLASLARTAVDVDNNATYQRCEQLQRQIELLSIKLRESRRQLEEAKATRPDDRVFEKLRCEKRLLEDKYRTLKDKYVRLKTDIKQSLEKRNKKRLAADNNRAGAINGSETDRSTSQKHECEKNTHKSPVEKAQDPILEESNNNNIEVTHTNSQMDSLMMSPPPTDSSDRTSPPPPPVALRRVKRHQARLKCSSTPRLDHAQHSTSPVENLRTQLKKLEDLEDLFPASTHTDTYLRYPFTDTGQIGSCELEFFRHRIHLERDSVHRAKEFLRQQRHSFTTRQRELRQRQSRAGPTFEQQQQQTSSRLHSELLRDSILQEERELSDMEVSLHRTRSLLGEKIIRLRQLEHSLQQASTTAAAASTPSPRVVNTEATLSDLSSHSGSSGFSSNENPSDGPGVRRAKSGAVSYKDAPASSDIARSLDTLNAEIRSLWDLLQQQNGDHLPPGPPPLLAPGSECPWPALSTLAEQLQQLRLQQQLATSSGLATSASSAASLAERAQGLRDWLRRTPRLDSSHLT